MEFNRNHYFIAGAVILLFGVQFRMVDSYVLNEPASRFLAEKFSSPEKQVATNTILPTMELAAPGSSVPLRTIRPPVWLGWACISVGAVLMLHSLALKRPE